MLFFVITGGLVPSSGTPKTTELVGINPPSVKQGPPLPEDFARHCSVLVGDEAYLIGGSLTSKKVLAIDIRTSTMTYKSELLYERPFGPTCALIKGSNSKIVVIGGEDLNSPENLPIEVFNIGSSTWSKGKR